MTKSLKTSVPEKLSVLDSEESEKKTQIEQWVKWVDQCAISTGISVNTWDEEQKHTVIKALSSWIDPQVIFGVSDGWTYLDDYLLHQALLRQRIGIQNNPYKVVLSAALQKSTTVKIQSEAVSCGCWDLIALEKLVQAQEAKSEVQGHKSVTRASRWEQESAKLVQEVFGAYVLAVFSRRLSALVQNSSSKSLLVPKRALEGLIEQCPPNQVSLSWVKEQNKESEPYMKKLHQVHSCYTYEQCKQDGFVQYQGARMFLGLHDANFVNDSIPVLHQSALKSGLFEYWQQQFAMEYQEHKKTISKAKENQVLERWSLKSKNTTEITMGEALWSNLKKQFSGVDALTASTGVGMSLNPKVGFLEVMRLVHFGSVRLHKVAGAPLDQMATQLTQWIDQSIAQSLHERGEKIQVRSFANVEASITGSSGGGRVNTLSRLAVNTDARQLAQYLIQTDVGFGMEQYPLTHGAYSSASIVDVVRFGRCSNILGALMYLQPEHHIELLLKSVHDFLLNPKVPSTGLKSLLSVGNKGSQQQQESFYFVMLCVLQTVDASKDQLALYKCLHEHYVHTDNLLEDLKYWMGQSTTCTDWLNEHAKQALKFMSAHVKVFDKKIKKIHQNESASNVLPVSRLWMDKMGQDPAFAAVIEALSIYKALSNENGSCNEVQEALKSKKVRRI